MGSGGFGGLIQGARERKGLSQARLAEKVFVNARTVSRWETEKTRPSGDSLKLLASVLEIPVEDLDAALATSVKASAAGNATEQMHPGVGDEVKTHESPIHTLPAVPSNRPKSRRAWAVAAAGLLVVGGLAAAVFQPLIQRIGQNPDVADGAGESATTVAATPSAIPAGAAAKAILGRDLKPDREECAGGGWALGPAGLGGVDYDVAYRCLMTGGGFGRLAFSLDQKYSRVQFVVGLLAGPDGGEDRVRFAFFRDGTLFPMTPFELEYGQTSVLDYSVEGVSRLEIELTDTEVSGTQHGSAPVIASLMLF